MDENLFHRLADASLGHLVDALERADADGALDVEYQNGVLTIDLPSGKQLLVSKHAPSKQVWLSSPLSGGLHFSFTNEQWCLADGRALYAILAQELHTLAAIEVSF